MLGVLVVAAALLYTPLAPVLGFTALPPAFFLLLVAMMGLYLLLVELGKRLFFEQETAANQRKVPAGPATGADASHPPPHESIQLTAVLCSDGVRNRDPNHLHLLAGDDHVAAMPRWTGV